MSSCCKILCISIIQQHYGPVVAEVAKDLFKRKAVQLHRVAPHIDRNKVKSALAVLVQMNLVKYYEDAKGVEFELLTERVLYMPRIPRYLLIAKSIYGDHSEALIEELFNLGKITLSKLLYHTAIKINETKEAAASNVSLTSLRDTFQKLAAHKLVMRSTFKPPPSPEEQLTEDTLYALPEVDIKTLVHEIEEKKPMSKQPDEGLTWHVNVDTFNVKIRDEIVVHCIEQRLDSEAGKLMKVILELANSKSDAWAPELNGVTVAEIKPHVDRLGIPKLSAHTKEYITILADDSCGVLRQIDDAGGGKYVVDMKQMFINIMWAQIENNITEAFSSQAARLFRVIKDKKYCDGDRVQQYGMMPGKEGKQLIYKLLDAGYIYMSEYRKGTGNAVNNAAGKSTFLLTTDVNQVSKMLQEQCYVAMRNCYYRREQEVSDNQRLIDKQQRIEAILHNMQDQQASQEQMDEIRGLMVPAEYQLLNKVQQRTDQLHTAEQHIDETVFILSLYSYYINSS